MFEMSHSTVEKRKPYWGLTSLMIVTGASRGIGKQITKDFCKQLGANSTVLLIARSITCLMETKHMILDVKPDINVEVESIDLNAPDYEKFLGLFTKITKGNTYDDYKLIHNAGSIVVDTPAAEITDSAKWNEYMTVNLYSASILTSAFLKLYENKKCSIINISSLCYKVPFKGLAMYCAVKASRELFFKVLAVENPCIKVLNYSPGPIDTDMFNQIAESCCFPDTKKVFLEMKSSNKLVKVEDTVSKLVDLLKRDCFKTGDSIDFYDEV